MLALIERQDLHRLESMVARSVRSGAIAPAGEAGYGHGGRSNQSSRRGVFKTGDVEVGKPVLSRGVILGASDLEPALISKAEFIDHRWREDFGVVGSDVHLPLVILQSKAGES